jgi:hypothetical protein
MIRAACLALLVPTLACAAGWTDIHGDISNNEKVIFRHVQTVTVQKQGKEEAYVQHVKADIIVLKGGARQVFPAQDCLHSTRADGNAWLSCSPDGTSPLAGRTYHQSPPAKDGVSPWICTRHCNALAPLIMKVSASRGSSR